MVSAIRMLTAFSSTGFAISRLISTNWRMRSIAICLMDRVAVALRVLRKKSKILCSKYCSPGVSGLVNTGDAPVITWPGGDCKKLSSAWAILLSRKERPSSKRMDSVLGVAGIDALNAL